MNNIVLRDKDTSHGEIVGIIRTERSAEEIQNIIYEVTSTIEAYNTDDIIEALPDDCVYEDIDYDSEVWF